MTQVMIIQMIKIKTKKEIARHHRPIKKRKDLYLKRNIV